MFPNDQEKLYRFVERFVDDDLAKVRLVTNFHG